MAPALLVMRPGLSGAFDCCFRSCASPEPAQCCLPPALGARPPRCFAFFSPFLQMWCLLLLAAPFLFVCVLYLGDLTCSCIFTVSSFREYLSAYCALGTVVCAGGIAGIQRAGTLELMEVAFQCTGYRKSVIKLVHFVQSI